MTGVQTCALPIYRQERPAARPASDDGGLQAAELTAKQPVPQVPAQTTTSTGAVTAQQAAMPAFVQMPAGEQTAIAPPAEGPTGMAPAVVDAKAAAHAADPATHGDEALHLQDATMPPNTHLFFAIYYAMTGLHGVHVVAGMGILAWLTWRAVRGDFSSKNFTAVDTGGLYWHIVDLIWIFLFPLFYLIH